MPGTRQLATIMFTDIAGYTALVHDDEKQARLLRDRHRDVLKSQHGEFNGKIIQYYGDGSLSIFHSAIEAVRCAIEIQKLFTSEPLVPVRVGLHLGDIILDPLSFTMNLYYGWLLAWRGKFDKAHKILLRLSDFHPHNRTVREAMGWLSLLEGDNDKAIEIFTHLEPELGYVYSRPVSLGCAYARAGNRDKANECMTRLEELEAEHAPMSFALDKAILYAALGERDKAFELLESMIDHHHGMIIFIKIDVLWEPLRADPRFELLVRRVTG